MSDARQTILKRVRRHLPEAVEHPTLDRSEWIRYDDPVQVFAESVAAVGGQCSIVDSTTDIAAQLVLDQNWSESHKRFCNVPDAGLNTNVDMNAIDDPHDLKDVDFAVLSGEFGVAENGAIWVTDDNAGQERLRHRVIYFLVQHLALVISADSIVSNMHEAYERLSFGDRRFGVFISGPSKTADIEQTLVIGAHGSRSLTVFVVRN